MLNKWNMNECRAINSLEDVSEAPEPESEPGPREAQHTQRLAGGLNWLATRTRPDINFAVSKNSSAATRAPQRAIALAKKVIRDLSGTRDHGIRMAEEGTHRF